MICSLALDVGMFAYGMEKAGFEIAAFCEIEEWPRRVLKKNFPGVPIYTDVRELNRERLESDGITGIDVITGGWPCQPYSTASAGKRYGEEHDSYLWPEMLRIIGDIKPRFVIGENVVGFISMGLKQVVSDLESLGYGVWAFVIPACAVGHDHLRNRVWILAYTDCNSEPSRAIDAEAPFLSDRGGNTRSVGGKNGTASGLDRRRLKALGNGLVWQIPYAIGCAINEREHEHTKAALMGDDGTAPPEQSK